MTGSSTSKPKPNRRRARTAASPKPPTKKNQLIRLLSARAGRDIAYLSETLGWQPHTTRAALSGLRKAGYSVTAEKAAKGKPARYRITAPTSEGVLPMSEVSADAG